MDIGKLKLLLDVCAMQIRPPVRNYYAMLLFAYEAASISTAGHLDVSDPFTDWFWECSLVQVVNFTPLQDKRTELLSTACTFHLYKYGNRSTLQLSQHNQAIRESVLIALIRFYRSIFYNALANSKKTRSHYCHSMRKLAILLVWRFAIFQAAVLWPLCEFRELETLLRQLACFKRCTV